MWLRRRHFLKPSLHVLRRHLRRHEGERHPSLRVKSHLRGGENVNMKFWRILYNAKNALSGAPRTGNGRKRSNTGVKICEDNQRDCNEPEDKEDE